MGVQVNFKPGWQQAAEAAEYFNGVASELVKGIVERSLPRLYLIAENGQRSLTILLWANDHESNELPDLVPLIRALHTDASRLSKPHVEEDLVLDVIRAMMALRVGDRPCFIELFSSPRAFMTGRDPLISIAVEGGRITLVSAAKLMFVQQTDALFGMTIAEHGSYLVEQRTEVNEGDIVLVRQDAA